jgi:DNA-binding IscR family transcriptional regulator
VFLLWLQVCWLIFFLGAGWVHTTYLFRSCWPGGGNQRLVGISDVVAIVLAVDHAFRHGQGPLTMDSLMNKVDLSAESVRAVVDRLVAADVLCAIASSRGNETRLTLSRPADRLPLLEIIAAVDASTKSPTGQKNPFGAPIERLRRTIDTALQGRTLADLHERAQK